MNDSLRLLISLDKIAEISGGSTPKRDEQSYWNGSIPWVTPTDLPMPGKGITEITSTKEKLTSSGLGACSAKLLPPGSVLYSSRATIGKIAIAGTALATNQGFINFTPLPCTYNRYLAYFLQFYTDQIFLLAGSTTFKEVTRGALKKFKIDLPTLSEQRKIVEILDQADALRKKRAESDRLSDRILPALFIKMFGDPMSNANCFERVILGDVILSGPQNGLYKHASFYGKGTPILRIDNFYNGEIQSVSDLKRLKLTNDEVEKFHLLEGDIVINRVNGSETLFGKSALVPKLDETTVFESNMMRFSVDRDQVVPQYIIECLQTPAVKQQLLSKCKHINQYSVNQKDIKSLEILLPPLALQEKFVFETNRFKQVRYTQDAAFLIIDHLFQTLLHQAFTGTLTASWRTAHMTELLQEMEHQAKQLDLDLTPNP